MSILSAPRSVPPEMPPDRVVPPSGFTAQLTVLAAAAMAFLAVFSLALGSAAGRLAERWDAELARTATLRISAPPDQIEAQTAAALRVLETTPGIGSARAMTTDEAQALLAPWFGPDLPVSLLPIPQLIEITTAGAGFDATGLRARLQGEVPGAVLDDHTRWRAPLIAAAGRLRFFGGLAIVLIALSMAAMVTLAAQVALAANEGVIRVLRQVGASDSYITRAFVRRFTLRALAGAAAGTAAGALAVLFLPGDAASGGFLTGLGFQGTGWLLMLPVPPFAGLVAWIATRTAARRSLRAMS